MRPTADLPLPSLDALRCFVEAARCLNFRAAARAVHLSPAAFSQRVQQLEGQLGVALLRRTTRDVALTDAGLALLPAAEAALDALRGCVTAVRAPGERPVELTVGTRHELGMSWLLPLVDELRERWPSLTLHLYFSSGTDLLLRVRSREVDCAVTSTRLVDPKLDAVRLHAEDYAFVAAPALLARAPLRRASDAAAHTLVDISGELPLFRYWRDAPGGGDGLRFGATLCLGTIAAVREVVLAGRGVAVLPRYFVAPDLAARRLTRVMPRVRLLDDYFRLVFRADDPRRAVYERLGAAMLAAPLR